MGYCAQPTPEMGDFSVEVRRESFYLRKKGAERVQDIIVYPYPYPGGGVARGSVEFLLEDIPMIRAALEQAERIASGKRLPDE